MTTLLCSLEVDPHEPPLSPVRVLCTDCGAVIAELEPVLAEDSQPAYSWAVCLGCGHSQRYGYRAELQCGCKGDKHFGSGVTRRCAE